jgi:hypothetical protein
MSEMNFVSTEKQIELPSGTIANYVEYTVLKDGVPTNYIMDNDLTDEQVDEIDENLKQLRNQAPKRIVISSEHPASVVIAEIQKQKIFGVI